MNLSGVKKVKTAVVGCGMISNIYIRNLKHLFSIIDLVAVCDIYAPAAQQKAETYGVDVDSVKTFFDVEVLNDSILMTKAADFLIANAVALPEPEEEKKEEEPAEAKEETEETAE